MFGILSEKSNRRNVFAIGTALSDSPVTTMHIEFRFLSSSYFFCFGHSFFLSIVRA